MGWPTIHAFAVEVELWTTLVVNVWLIFGGVSFLILRIRKDPRSLQAQISRSLLAGFGGGIAVAILFSILSLFFGVSSTLSRIEQIVILMAGIPILVAIFWVNYWIATKAGE